MAEAIVGPLLSKLQEVALKEGRALAGVGDEIGRLRERLMWLHALLHETDLRTRSEGNQLVHVLARQMRDIAFEAEDAVDHFVLEVDLGQSWRRAARLFLSKFGTQIYSRYTLSQKIKSMNARLQDIHDNSAKYSSNYASPAVTTWRASRYIPPVRHNWDDMDSTEPNKRKKTELTELLLDMEKPAGHVIYVVGESGIGKRHLVKKVYEGKAINEKFTVRIWENFSRNSSSRSIADKIVGKLETEWKKMQAEDHNSTYLVVVHCPMSSPTLGDSIVEKFPKGSKGSNIVVATTSSPPKEHGGIVKLGYLDKTASRTLFNNSLGLEGRRVSVYRTEMRKNLDETIQVASS